jgi:chemotaxis protein MotB
MIRVAAIGGLLLVLSTPVPGEVPADGRCAGLIAEGDAQLDAMRRYVESFDASLEQLKQNLRAAEQRNVDQTRQIEALQAELRAQRERGPGAREALRRDFFRAARRSLPPSALYEILPDRIIVASDPVFIFGKGELGAEGRDRLRPLAERLRALVGQLPDQAPWRLVVEGHSDVRPLRANPRFETNWELSAARAVSMLRFLADSGLPPERLAAVGLASTRVRDPGDSTASHRRNRRIELRLGFEQGAGGAD